MDLELLTVGSELLLGFTVDTNAAEIARAAATVGARVTRRTTVPDDAEAIRTALADALRRTRFVIVTGGLGPTRDDVTKRAAAQLFDAPLELDAAYLAALERRWAALGVGPMPASNRSQAAVPRGADVLANPRGTAPGLWLDGPPGIAVLLPGVPHEMRGLVHEAVLPRLAAAARSGAGGGSEVLLSRTLRTTGVPESALASKLDAVEHRLGTVTLAYLPSVAGVDLRLTVQAASAPAGVAALDEAESLLLPALGDRCYGRDDADLAAAVLDALRRTRRTLAVAESCTGGLVGARLTAIPGASDVFLGGVVSYADVSKVRDLEVPASLLEAEGAVSEPVVLAMMEGARRRFGAVAGIAVTGIAGPTGGRPGKPVGTVWLAAGAGARRRVVTRRIPGDREAVRQRAAQAALDLLRGLVREQGAGSKEQEAGGKSS